MLGKGICSICKARGPVNVLQGTDKDYYSHLYPEQANSIIKLCNNCFVKLVKKQYSTRDKYVSREHQSASITSTNNTTSQSRTKSTIEESKSSSSSSLQCSKQLSKSPTATDSQSFESPRNARTRPGPLSSKPKRVRKQREIILNEISSDEDEDTFDPGVRCPTIQPLIKKRKTPFEPNFQDHQAPIFDTSQITGG